MRFGTSSPPGYHRRSHSSVAFDGSVAVVAYRETAAPAPLRELVECAWTNNAPSEGGRVLPDGCMDLITMDGEVFVAGPDTAAASVGRAALVAGLRFRPGALPRLLGVPAVELVDRRVRLAELHPMRYRSDDLVEIASAMAAVARHQQTAPWPVGTLHHVTGRLGAGARVAGVAEEIGWSARTMRRQCEAVYGYGPATLRRILRFRRAVSLLRSGHPTAAVAAESGYADQPHLHREVREFAGVSVGELLRLHPRPLRDPENGCATNILTART